jgi:hypothetical protein
MPTPPGFHIGSRYSRPLFDQPVAQPAIVAQASSAVDASNRDRHQRVNVATCAKCGTLSGLHWAGWRAYRTDDPEQGGPPPIVFHCPACARDGFSIRVD